MKPEDLKFAAFGGDERQRYLCRFLRGSGCFVGSFRVPGEPDAEDWRSLLKSADCLLLPVPATRDGVRLRAEGSGEEIRLDSLLGTGARVIFGGKLPSSFRSHAENAGFTVFDYLDFDRFEEENALPTAEGAISIAMQRLPITLEGASAVITGYGRIGRILCRKLVSLGASVTVFERRADLHTDIVSDGARAMFFTDVNGRSELSRIPSDCRVIFNTVPARMFCGEALERLSTPCLLIDLASPPGGVDMKAAEARGIECVWATALPGKYAPESAARSLFAHICRALGELGG